MRRTTFKLLGIGCVGLGIAGAFLPLLPSTIFFILAAASFARSSPALEARILKHPVVGPPVLAWRKYGAIPLKAKVFALVGMAIGYAVFLLVTQPVLWLAVVVALAIIASAVYVATRPSGPKDPSLDECSNES
ncbi:YbaN family protein [Roseibium salinum]|uniref:YbaN family protein n=1 Tax=Roseibium salinum TaxID=1604349 RepID=UPI00360DA873